MDSRLTIAISAALRIVDTGPKAVAGFCSNLSVRSVKWTSPPNASVISGAVVGVGLAVADVWLDGAGEVGDGCADGVLEQALTNKVTQTDAMMDGRRGVTEGSVRVRAHKGDP